MAETLHSVSFSWIFDSFFHNLKELQVFLKSLHIIFTFLEVCSSIRTMSFIVTAGSSLTSTLWQDNLPLLACPPPTMLHPTSILIAYGSLLSPEITSLGAGAWEQTYPISKPTLQSNRLTILSSIGRRWLQFLAVVVVGIRSSSAGIDVLV